LLPGRTECDRPRRGRAARRRRGHEGLKSTNDKLGASAVVARMARIGDFSPALTRQSCLEFERGLFKTERWKAE